MDALAKSLGRSPELFPHVFDVRADAVSFVRLTRIDYQKASFLDGRVATPHTPGRTVPWRQVVAAVDASRLQERCQFIFHIGHVGSTLLSQLMGAHPQLFALREPAILRTFAQVKSEPESQGRVWSDGDFETRLSAMLKLYSRTFEAKQTALVKTTSFVSELAPGLMARACAPKALAMFVSPETYLATILGGPNSRQEAKLLAANRLRRLHRRVGRDIWRLASLSEGEALAVAWACETSALADAAQAGGTRLHKLDFDAFLADPHTQLSRAFRHSEIKARDSEMRAILGGPDMHRYSKAPEYAYDAQLRDDVLNEARATHGAEIKRGLEWLERSAAEAAPVRDAMRFASI